VSGAEDTFLRRWSQRKHASRSAAPKAGTAEAPALPSVESLDFDSDFKAFMHAKVDEAVKRAALRRLFSDPRFNVMDGLDIYIDDYSIEDPIPAAMLAGLEHARATLLKEKSEENKEEAEEAANDQGEPDAAA
jgi:hypothetical protein